MAYRIRDIVDLGLNALTNVVEETLTSDPGNTLGRFWFRSDTKRRSYYDGATVQRLANIADSLSTFASPTGDVAWGTNKITGLKDPTLAQDAATKNYVDAAALGLTVHASCRLATAAALAAGTYSAGVFTETSNGALTVDGVAAAVGDRILVKNQATPSQNGIYTVTAIGSGAAVFVLTRATDFNVSADVTPGVFTFIEAGTANAATGWILTTAGPITLDTTSLTFTQMAAAASFSAGSHIAISGSVISATPPDFQNARVVVTTNMASLSAPGATLDGVSMAAGDRVLLTGQTTTSQNGLWIWNGAAVAMTRPTDFASGNTTQAYLDCDVDIDAGTVGAGTTWRITSTGTLTIDTSAILWAQFQTNVTGAIGILPIGSGGTGATTAAAALAALGGVSKFAANIGNGALTSIVVTHALGTLDIIMSVVEVSTGNQILCGMQATSTTTATFTFSVAPTTNQYRVTIIG